MSADFLTKASQYNLSRTDVTSMLSLATPYTGPEGNLRYKEWYFTRDTSNVVITLFHKPKPKPPAPKVEHQIPVLAPEEVEELNSPYRCKFCKDTHRQLVWDECGWCGGAGCHRCQQGQVKNHIPCQSCNPKKAK